MGSRTDPPWERVCLVVLRRLSISASRCRLGSRDASPLVVSVTKISTGESGGLAPHRIRWSVKRISPVKKIRSFSD